MFNITITFPYLRSTNKCTPFYTVNTQAIYTNKCIICLKNELSNSAINQNLSNLPMMDKNTVHCSHLWESTYTIKHITFTDVSASTSCAALLICVWWHDSVKSNTTVTECSECKCSI
jgi:hypothetical protein